MADETDLQVSPDLLENPLLPTGVAPPLRPLFRSQEADQIGGMTWDQFRPLMQHFESGGRNVPNYLFDPGHTASGLNQITNTTWNRYAGNVGAPKLEWPQTPMDRPLDEQNKVAQAIFQAEGPGPWANYNPQLANVLAPYGFKAGGMRPPGHPGISAPLPSELMNPVVAAASPEAPHQQTAVPTGQTATTPQGPNLLVVLSILKTLMAGTHSFQPVDYDPWAAVRRQT